jgi:hypothetical protein
MPRALTPDEWKKVSASLQAQDPTSAPGGDDGLAPPVQSALDFGKGLGKGAAKGVASMIPESIEGKSWKDWSAAPGDPNSMSERFGETGGDIAANVAPFMLTPELGVGAKLGQLAMRAGPRAVTWATRAGRAIEDTAKGAFGGGTEAAAHNEETKDPNQVVNRVGRGAETGAVSASAMSAGRMAYEALPPGVKHMLHLGAGLAAPVAGAVLAIDKGGGHHWIPHWMLYGLGGLATGAAATAAHVPAAVTGAATERAAQGAGYEQTDKTGYSVTKDSGSGDYIEDPARR